MVKSVQMVQPVAADLASSGQMPTGGRWIDFLLALAPVRWVLNKLGSAKFLERLAALFFAVGVLVTLAYATLRPDYNWDMVAYVATALEDRFPDPVDLHRETWSRIDAGASERQEFNLKQSNPYNLHQWENPADFKSQLSMYRVKVLYIAVLKMLDPLIGVVAATFVLSILPSLIFGALCLWWLWREQALQSAFLLLPFLFLADYLPLTLVVTPDMLVAAISMAAIYSLHRKHDWLAAILLFSTVLMRPDNFVLIIAIALTAFLFGWKKLPIAIAFVASVIAIAVIGKIGGHPGWWPHFYFSNVQIQNSMTNFHPAFSFYDLARGYVRGIVISFQHNDWTSLYMALMAAWALLYKFGYMKGERANALCFAMAIGTLGKFVSFPLPDDRFYFVFIAGLMIILLSSWKPQFQIERMRR